MRNKLHIIIFLFATSNCFSQSDNTDSLTGKNPIITKIFAKEKIYNSIDSIIAADPDSVFKVSFININPIEYIPKVIYKLKNLEELTILCSGMGDYTDHIKRIPRRLTHLTNLKKLHFGFAAITRVPRYIRRLDKLEVLTFSWCKIKSISNSIGDLKNLKEFEICVNYYKIKSIPKSVTRLKNLKYFAIESFRFNNMTTSDPVNDYKKRIKAAYKNDN